MPEKDLANQKKQEKTKGIMRASANKNVPFSEGLMGHDISSSPLDDASFNPPIQTHATILSEAPSNGVRAILTRQLQQTYGNRYVQRLVNSIELQTKLKSRSIQRVEGEESEDIYSDLEPSTEVPDLTKGTVDKVRLAIVNGRFQDAIDLILAEAQATKMPNLSQCQPPTMEYYPAAGSWAGCTSCAYNPEDNTVAAIKVLLGKKAFASVAYLYSTMMHEYQHVEQRLVDPSGITDSYGMRDFMAYSWEIYHARETGLINQLDKLTHRGRLMRTMGFDKMTALEQDQNIEVYQEAIKIVQDAIGDPSWQP